MRALVFIQVPFSEDGLERCLSACMCVCVCVQTMSNENIRAMRWSCVYDAFL